MILMTTFFFLTTGNFSPCVSIVEKTLPSWQNVLLE